MQHSSGESNHARRETELWKRQDCTCYPFRYLSPCRYYLDAVKVPLNLPSFHIAKSAYAKIIRRHRDQSLRRLTKALPSSKSKPWTTNPTRLSPSIRSFFTWTNPLRSDTPGSCGNGTAATRPRIRGSRRRWAFPWPPNSMIPAGGKLDVNGYLVIPLGINNPSGGPEENKFAFQLLHDSGTSENTASGQIRVSEGILFDRTNTDETKWTVVENCKELPLK